MNIYTAALYQIDQLDNFRNIQLFDANKLLRQVIDIIDTEFKIYIPFNESMVLIENANLFLLWNPPESKTSNAASLAIHFGLLDEAYEIKLRDIKKFECYIYVDNAISRRIMYYYNNNNNNNLIVNAAAYCIEYNRKLLRAT